MSCKAWYLPAHAKLNLSLRIVGRRADGYHLLDTLFHELELHDDLVLQRQPAPGVQLTVTADEPALQVTPGPDNLVTRALLSLQGQAGVAGGFRVHLHKRIPHGGGLGGGSSDAAAALRLAQAACPELANVDLRTHAPALGADVAFFLHGGTQRGTGVGEQLAKATAPNRHFVLVLPPFPCPTAEVYKMHARLWNAHGKGASVTKSAPPLADPVLDRMHHQNDLLPAAECLRPELAALRAKLARAGLGEVPMTGSGSTLFLVAEAAEQAAQLAQTVLAAVSGEPAFAGVRTLITASRDHTVQPILVEERRFS